MMPEGGAKKSGRLVWYETEVRFVIVLLVLFLLLLNQSIWTIGSRYRSELENEIIRDTEKMANLLHSLLLKVIKDSDEPDFDSEELHAIDELLMDLTRSNISYTISIMNKKGVPVLPKSRMQATEEAAPLSVTEWEKLERGFPIQSNNFSDQTHPVVNVMVGLRTNHGLRGALRVDREALKLALLNRVMNMLFAAQLASLGVTVILVIYYVRFVLLPFRIIRQRALTFLRQRAATDLKGLRSSDVQFVIDTFEQTITSLEAQEQQLQQLYKKSEARVSEVETYNQYILQSISCGVVTFDAEGVCTTLNSHAVKLLGIPLDSVLNRRTDDTFGGGHPLTQLFRECLLGKRQESKEWEYERPDGVQRIFELSASLLQDHRNTILGVIMVFTDQTEFTEMVDRVRQKHHLEMIGEMSAGLAHELRNPLAAMAGYLNLIHRLETSNEKTKSYLEELQENIKVLDRIIRDFLNFARPTVFQVITIDLVELIHGIATNEIRSSGKDIHIEFEVTDDLRIAADANLLGQAFTNLVINALEAIPGAGLIRISGGISASNPNEIWLEFMDSGGGVPAAEAERIFQPFFTTKISGSGLGLSIVQRIIVNHNGHIKLQHSPEGWGACFRISLPRQFSPINEMGETCR